VPIILYVMLVKMHLTDSRLGLILPMVAGACRLRSSFSVSSSNQFRELQMPLLDGCTELTAFQSSCPISGPAFATVAVSSLSARNEYFSLDL
jgi:ABC-type glycerol-3-phosphate transport system permease component